MLTQGPIYDLTTYGEFILGAGSAYYIYINIYNYMYKEMVTLTLLYNCMDPSQNVIISFPHCNLADRYYTLNLYSNTCSYLSTLSLQQQY